MAEKNAIGRRFLADVDHGLCSKFDTLVFRIRASECLSPFAPNAHHRRYWQAWMHMDCNRARCIDTYAFQLHTMNTNQSSSRVESSPDSGSF